MKRIYSVNVTGVGGYSFGVKCNETDENSVIDLALDAGLFDDDSDAKYAVVEDITDYPYDVAHFKTCTYEI